MESILAGGDARRRATAAWSCAAFLCAALAPADAGAAGLYFSEPGVRPLARGGAFVAGGDDLSTAWYNPAGFYDAGTEFLFDASWLNYTNDYTRRAIVDQRDPNTGQVVSSYEQTFPAVRGSTPVLPIPSLLGSLQVHRDWVIALGAVAPYAAIVSYPDAIDNNQPAPQRYSLITLDGSALAIVGAAVAWRPHRMVRVGAGFEMLLGKFVSTTMFSGCIPDRFFCAPEQPEWDTLTQLTAGPIAAPSGNVGVKVLPHKQWKIGVAFQAPFFVRAPATVHARLPKTPVFEQASQEGENASVAFQLPWMLRFGVQFEPVQRLALELDGTVEGWAMHDNITVTPKDIVLRNIPGFPNPYPLAEQVIPHNFRNAGSVRLGGEYGIPIGNYKLTVRGGLSYETSAVPAEYVSALTVDGQKIATSLGGGLHVGHWRFDLVYAHIFEFDTDVDPRDAKGPLLIPVKASTPEPTHTVNGGHYSVAGNVLGLGLMYQFDRPRWVQPDEEPKPEPKPEPKKTKKKPAETEDL